MYSDYFLPKSAGISPHCGVSHFIMGTVISLLASQYSARAMSSKRYPFFAVCGNLVRAFLALTHAIAVAESL